MSQAKARHARFYLDYAIHHQKDQPWFNREWSQIRQAWDWVVQHNRNNDLIIDYVKTFENFLDHNGLWQIFVGWSQTGIEACRKVGNKRDEGLIAGDLGRIYYFLGDTSQAIDCYRQSLALAQEIGDDRGAAIRLNNLGTAYAGLGELQQAIGYQEQALALDRKIGDQRGEAHDLGSLGINYFRLGDRVKAQQYLTEAVEACRELNLLRPLGTLLGNLGVLATNKQEMEQAASYFQEALQIAGEIGDRQNEVYWLGRLGVHLAKSSHFKQALVYTRSGLTLAHKINSPRVLVTALLNMAKVHRFTDNLPEATRYYRLAYELANQLGDRSKAANSAWQLGLIYEMQGDYVQAAELMEIRVAYARAINHPEYQLYRERRLIVQQKSVEKDGADNDIAGQ